MSAEVTYNAGRSYRIGTHRFLQGVSKSVEDQAVIDRCRVTVGFAVTEKAKPKRARKARQAPATTKKVRPVDEGLSKPKKKRSSE